ncbi:MAG: hypothetical protein R6X25_02890 [Candidatus Krumholzibacteriia bacterium]
MPRHHCLPARPALSNPLRIFTLGVFLASAAGSGGPLEAANATGGAAGDTVAAVAAVAADGAERVAFVREKLAAGELRPAYAICDSLRKAGAGDGELVRIEGEIHWLAGSAGALAVADSLRARGDDLAAEALLLKVDLLLGRPHVRERLRELEAAAPGDPGLRLVRWLLELDSGSWEEARRSVTKVARGVDCAYVPATALMLAAVDRDSTAAADAAEVMEAQDIWLLTGLRRKVAAGALFSGPCRVQGRRELPYVDCRPYMCVRLTAADGHQVTLTLDTGTGSGLLTLHGQALGEALAGPEVLRLTDGIQYHYMDGPADVVIKRVDFADPPVRGRPVESFDGRLEDVDGCVSPFAFPGAAVTVDAAAGRVWLRDRDDLAAHVAALDPDRSAVVPFVRRGGWIFVPVRLNGHEVLLMLESGSRDVNINSLAARRLGIETYRSTSTWRGEEHEVTRADLTVEIGGLTYRCPDAFVTGYVLGNNLTGLAGAGDLGPDFLRHYRWTIDPFDDRLILEQLPIAGDGS